MALTRELIVTYGAYVISTATSRDLDGKVQHTKGYETSTVEFSWFVYGATAAAFAAECVAAESAFRKPYQSLTITQSGETLLSLSHASSTGFDSLPEAIKGEDVGDTGRSRRYTARIEFQMPATTGAESQDGLRELSVGVSYDPSRRRTVTISGVFTASGATDARSQYESKIDAVETSVFGASDLNITTANRELVGEPSVSSDTNNKTCEFSRTWEELVYSQAGSSLNDATLVQQRLSIARRKEGPGDTQTAERLATLDLTYDAWLDKDESTDLRSKYDEIRTWLVTQIDTTLSGSQFAVVEEIPEFYYDENKISVRMTVLGQIGGESVIEQRVSVDDDDLKGWEIVAAWTGDPLSAYKYHGPRVVVRTVTHTLKTIGRYDNIEALAFAKDAIDEAKGRAPDDANGGEWTIIRQRPQAAKATIGLSDDTMRTTEINVTTQMRYTKSPESSPYSPDPIVRAASTS